MRPIAYLNSADTPDFFSDAKISEVQYLAHFQGILKSQELDPDDQLPWLERLYEHDIQNEINHQCSTHDDLNLDHFQNLPKAFTAFSNSYHYCTTLFKTPSYQLDLAVLLALYRIIEDINIEAAQPILIGSSKTHNVKVSYNYDGHIIEFSLTAMSDKKDNSFYIFDNSELTIYNLIGNSLSEKQKQALINKQSVDMGLMLNTSKFIVKAGIDQNMLIKLIEGEFS